MFNKSRDNSLEIKATKSSLALLERSLVFEQHIDAECERKLINVAKEKAEKIKELEKSSK